MRILVGRWYVMISVSRRSFVALDHYGLRIVSNRSRILYLPF